MCQNHNQSISAKLSKLVFVIIVFVLLYFVLTEGQAQVVTPPELTPVEIVARNVERLAAQYNKGVLDGGEFAAAIVRRVGSSSSASLNALADQTESAAASYERTGQMLLQWGFGDPAEYFAGLAQGIRRGVKNFRPVAPTLDHSEPTTK